MKLKRHYLGIDMIFTLEMRTPKSLTAQLTSFLAAATWPAAAAGAGALRLLKRDVPPRRPSLQPTPTAFKK